MAWSSGKGKIIMKPKRAAFQYFIFTCAGIIIGMTIIGSVLALLMCLGGKISIMMALIVAAISIACSIGSIIIAIALTHLLGQLD